MIDNVRKTVLAIINKENRGYISPEEFNLFANQAQLEIFEDYFYDYARWVDKSNKRLANSEYSNIPKNIREKIDIFAEYGDLTYNAIDLVFEAPADTYRVESVFLGNDEIEEVMKGKLRYLLKSNLTAPTTEYPVYVRLDDKFEIYPNTIISGVKCYYLRTPSVPKWTYQAISGNPVFNISALDYQDFEIHPSDETELVIKILSYCGISIRESDIYEIAEGKDNTDFQKENI